MAAKELRFEQGDEIVFLHRRRFKVVDEETKQEVEQVQQQELGAVRCPEPCVISGHATCEPEFIADDHNEGRDKRQLVLRLPMRY